MVDYKRQHELEVMQNPSRWPWPRVVLFLRRRAPEQTLPEKAGLLSNVGPMVKLAGYGAYTYPSWDALLDDGWMIE